MAARLSGMLEGLADALERHDVARSSRDAVQEAGEIMAETHAAVDAVRRDPVLGELGRETRAAMSRTGHEAAQGLQEWRHDVATQAHDAWDAARRRIEHDAQQATQTVRRAEQDLSARWDHIAEGARRTARLPGRLAQEARHAVRAKATSARQSIGWLAAGAAVAATAWVVLAIALVQLATRWVGTGWGALAVAALYVATALGAWLASRAARRRGDDEVKQRKRRMGIITRRAGAPWRQALARDPADMPLRSDGAGDEDRLTR